MSNDKPTTEPADILAAEVFAVPAPDPTLAEEPEDTDVLAAEEFAVPAPDPALAPEDLELPADLVGEEPHDVLAAEEFAMPAPDEAHVPPSAGAPERISPLRIAAVSLAPLLVVLFVWRRLARGRTTRQAASD